MNGSLKFLQDIKNYLPVTFHAEHYDRGQWLQQGYVQKMENFCSEIHNPLQPWFYASKGLKGCPIQKDVCEYLC